MTDPLPKSYPAPYDSSIWSLQHYLGFKVALQMDHTSSSKAMTSDQASVRWQQGQQLHAFRSFTFAGTTAVEVLARLPQPSVERIEIKLTLTLIVIDNLCIDILWSQKDAFFLRQYKHKQGRRATDSLLHFLQALQIQFKCLDARTSCAKITGCAPIACVEILILRRRHPFRS